MTPIQGECNKVQQLINEISYDAHKASLDAGIKALVKDVKRDWANGADTQSAMMDKMAKELLAWLPDLWRTAVEDGLEFPLVQRCTFLCTEAVDKIECCGSR